MSEQVRLARTAGAPMRDKQKPITPGGSGPILRQDQQPVERLACHNRFRQRSAEFGVAQPPACFLVRQLLNSLEKTNPNPRRFL